MSWKEVELTFSLICSELYQISNLGEGTEDEFSSAMGFGDNEVAFFEPHELRSLFPIDTLDSLCPLTDAVVSFQKTIFLFSKNVSFTLSNEIFHYKKPEPLIFPDR